MLVSSLHSSRLEAQSRSLPLEALTLPPASDRLGINHPWVRDEAEAIAQDGFAGFVHVVRVNGGFQVVAGGTTVQALRLLVLADRDVWDRKTQSFRSATAVYREVDCLIDG